MFFFLYRWSRHRNIVHEFLDCLKCEREICVKSILVTPYYSINSKGFVRCQVHNLTIVINRALFASAETERETPESDSSEQIFFFYIPDSPIRILKCSISQHQGQFYFAFRAIAIHKGALRLIESLNRLEYNFLCIYQIYLPFADTRQKPSLAEPNINGKLI